MYPSVQGHLGCFQFLGIRNHSDMNIRVQVLVWSWFIYIFTSVPHSHVPSHIGNCSSLHNVYLLFYAFMINVCSSCVRAFLIYTWLYYVAVLILYFLHSALWFWDPSMLPWAVHLVHCAVCCRSLGVRYYHILDLHSLYRPLPWHHMQTHSGIWYVSPSEPGWECLERMSRRGLLGHINRICAYLLWVVPDCEQSPLLAGNKTGAAGNRNCSFSPFSPHGNNSQNRYSPSWFAKPQDTSTEMHRAYWRTEIDTSFYFMSHITLLSF